MITEKEPVEECAKLNPETLDFILAYTKDAPEQQLQDAKFLDDKMVKIFAAGSVVIGLAGISTKVSGDWILGGLLMCGLLAYAVLAITALRHLKVRDFRGSFHADRLWPEYWMEKPESIKHALVDDIAEAYGHNKELLGNKGRTVDVALVATAVEVAMVGAAIVWSVFSV